MASNKNNKILSASSAYNNYKNVQSKKPSAFKYNDNQLKKLYNDAMNRKDFSFDLNGNAFYNQYKDKFTKQGQLAMADTVGQVAAASGGYGNSYAQTAGQQVYQNNLNQLNDIVPELYNLAFQQYQYEGQQLQDKYNMASGERDFAYGQYRDRVGDWQYDNDTAYNIYADTRDYEYQQGRDKVADAQWQKTYDRNVYESDRNYNWGVYESDRDYNRGVFESDRSFNEDRRQFNESLAFDKQQAATSNAQWDKSYNLSQQELEETIRHNQANESYNMRSLGNDDPYGDTEYGKDENEGKKADFDPNSITPTASYENLSKQSKQFYDQAMLRGYDVKGENGVIMQIYRGIENESITPEDAMWLFNSFGYDPVTHKFKTTKATKSNSISF